MKNISIPPLLMPVTEFASQGNALLGIKGGGKSYGAMQIAEQLYVWGVPFIALDPSGVWRNLKIPGPGKDGRGFPIVVAHPDNGDLPLTPGSAVEIVRAAMRENISLVIDLYSMKLSKADWRHIVQSVVDVLLYENKGLRHLFIEEAAEFCPQRVQPEYGKVYASIEKLARMGGNASLGYTLINQRAEEVNKAVLEICDCLILFRQKGINSLASLEKWLTFSDRESARTIVEKLPTLPSGQCFIWPRGADKPTLCQVNVKKSFHPDRQNPDVKPSGAGTDVTKFVTTLNQSLEKVLKEAKANDPAELKREIRTLHQTIKNMTAISHVKAPVDPRIKELIQENTALRKGFDTYKAVKESTLRQILADVYKLRDKVSKYLDTPEKPNVEVNRAPDHVQHYDVKEHSKAMSERNPIEWTSPVKPLPDQRVRDIRQCTEEQGYTGNGEQKLGKAERKILTVLANFSPCSKQRLALMCGYSARGGGFNNSIYSLRGAGLIAGTDSFDLTEAGQNTIGPVDPLPTGEALLNHWLAQLGGCEKKILSFLYTLNGHAVNKDAIANNTGYNVGGGGFNNAIYKLRGLGLIEGQRELKISETFFV